MQLQIADRTDQLRHQIGVLELLATTHNGVLKNLTELETPLMIPMLRSVANLVQKNLAVSHVYSYGKMSIR